MHLSSLKASLWLNHGGEFDRPPQPEKTMPRDAFKERKIKYIHVGLRTRETTTDSCILPVPRFSVHPFHVFHELPSLSIRRPSKMCPWVSALEKPGGARVELSLSLPACLRAPDWGKAKRSGSWHWAVKLWAFSTTMEWSRTVNLWSCAGSLRTSMIATPFRHRAPAKHSEGRFEPSQMAVYRII